jgi:hypothetical protein
MTQLSRIGIHIDQESGIQSAVSKFLLIDSRFLFPAVLNP